MHEKPEEKRGPKGRTEDVPESPWPRLSELPIIAVLVGLGGILLYFAYVSAGFAAWTNRPEGVQALWEQLNGVLLSATLGVIGLALVRFGLKRPVVSWWLSLGLLPALFVTLDLLWF